MDIDRELLNAADQILLAVMIFIIMFGMGASLTLKDFRAALRNPRGVLIGFASQFGLMPLVALGLAIALSLPPALAIALVMIGCLPGGTTSNMFAYFSRGSVALSISMTAASTVLALVMLPLLLNLYAGGFAREIDAALRSEGATTEFVIPHLNIIVSLLLVLLPVAGGMVFRRFVPAWAKAAEDTAGFMAIVVILFLLASVGIRHSGLFIRTPWEIYAATIGVGLGGFWFGYLASAAFRLAPRFQRAISLETGIQNGPIAFAIIMLSFSDPIRSEMLWMAVLYSTFIVLTSSGVTLYFRKRGKFDWEVYRNNLIHRRLFGEDYPTRYPEGFLPPKVARNPDQR
jgi:sodium/bile acid cotransporter 2